MKEKAQLKREHGEILFLQNETTVMVIKAGKSHGGSAVLLNECIGILQKLLSEFTERPEHDRGILMLQPGVWLDEKRRSVWEEGREISVTRREYEVLHMLFRNKGRVLTYEQNGVVHYILSNENVHLAAWVNGTCECYIVGNLELEEFMTMIDSIYV